MDGVFRDQSYMTKWADIVIPLLPVMFDISDSDGAATLYKDKQDSFDLRTVQRRWLMNAFFPGTLDEFAAWKSVAPRATGKLPKLDTNWISSKYANKQHSNYDSEEDGPSLPPGIAALDQMETMAQLAHPIYGLPSLSISSIGEFREVAPNLRSVKDVDEKIMVQAASYYYSDQYIPVGRELANRAIGAYDLLASLKAIKKEHPDYEFERLYGLFAYLSKQGLEEGARREYALYLLPRLFDNAFKKDMLFYTKFIRESLISSPELYSREEIFTLLSSCYEKAKKYPEWNHKTDPAHQTASTYELSLALAPFAKDAPHHVAFITADWLYELLDTNPKTSSWIDSMIFQLVNLDQKLIHHHVYKRYFEQNPKEHMALIEKYVITPNLSWKEIDLLNQIGFKDYELFIHLSGVRTVGKPSFGIYEQVDRWAAVFEQADPINSLGIVWNKILGEISKEVKDWWELSHLINEKESASFRIEKERASLRRLVAAVDNYSKNAERDFDILQPLLGHMRLAADYTFDPNLKHVFALNEIKILPTRPKHSHKIFSGFIPKFLLDGEAAKAVTPEQISKLLTTLHERASTHPDYLSEDWNSVFSNIISRFTIEVPFSVARARVKSVPLPVPVPEFVAVPIVPFVPMVPFVPIVPIACNRDNRDERDHRDEWDNWDSDKLGHGHGQGHGQGKKGSAT
ncbi:unnamed protein product [Sphagnum jensenii]|uniref:Uncharacterized protein n=1 Tax=Sphagnum jensenii TaxID=128206 RepID=A0ABP0VDM4_9BRYO